MRTAALCASLAATGLLCACSLVKTKPKDDMTRLTIRYVNLNTVYEFLLNRDRDALSVRTQKEATEKKLQALELNSFSPAANREKIYKEIDASRKSLADLRAKASHHKARLLDRINLAMKNVARTLEADFILNIGEGVVYSRREYDITEDVIRELLRLEKRQDEVSR